jgi:hypothetical protein
MKFWHVWIVAASSSILAGCSKSSSPESGTTKANSAVVKSAATPASAPALMARLVAGSNDPAYWEVFVPKDSDGANVSIDRAAGTTPSSRAALELRSDRWARYGITPRIGAISVAPGQRYRLSASVRAETAQDGSGKGERSVILRATLRGPRGDFEGGHYYVGAKGTLFEPTPANFGNVPTPATWTKLESVIEIPDGVTQLKFFVFNWYADSMIYVDDPKVEQVASDTPLTPLL